MVSKFACICRNTLATISQTALAVGLLQPYFASARAQPGGGGRGAADRAARHATEQTESDKEQAAQNTASPAP
eukprot:9608666-Lingulodinium_polyedra.AAC.1